MPGSNLLLRASRHFGGSVLSATTLLGLAIYYLFSPVPWVSIVCLVLIPVVLTKFRQYVELAGPELVVQQYFDTHTITPREATLRFDRYRLRVVFKNGNYDLVPGAVDLGTDLIWYSRPARRRTLEFLAAAQDAGFEVEVTKQPKWAHELAAQLGLNSQSD